MSLSWNENDLFTVGASCSFREFIREPLKFQLRNSKVCVLRSFHHRNPVLLPQLLWVSVGFRWRKPIHLWDLGVVLGDLSVFYQFSDICLVQQMLSGVNSERGITAGSTVILSVIICVSIHS